MDANEYFNQVYKLVEKNEIRKAISILNELLKNSPKSEELVIQSSRYNDIQKKIRLGIVSFDNANLTENKIKAAIIDMVNEIRVQYEENSIVKEEVDGIVTKKSFESGFHINYKLMGVFFITLLTVLLMVFYFSSGSSITGIEGNGNSNNDIEIKSQE